MKIFRISFCEGAKGLINKGFSRFCLRLISAFASGKFGQYGVISALHEGGTFRVYLKLRFLMCLRYKIGLFMSQLAKRRAFEIQRKSIHVSQIVAFEAFKIQKRLFCISNEEKVGIRDTAGKRVWIHKDKNRNQKSQFSLKSLI